SCLRRGRGAAVHGRPVDPEPLRLHELRPVRPELPVEPIPAGDHPRGVRLEEQRRGSQPVRDRARRRLLGDPARDRPRLQRLRPGVRSFPAKAPDRHMNEDAAMTAAPPAAPISVHIDTAIAAATDGAEELSTVMKMSADKLSVTYGSRIAVREVT